MPSCKNRKTDNGKFSLIFTWRDTWKMKVSKPNCQVIHTSGIDRYMTDLLGKICFVKCDFLGGAGY